MTPRPSDAPHDINQVAIHQQRQPGDHAPILAPPLRWYGSEIGELRGTDQSNRLSSFRAPGTPFPETPLRTPAPAMTQERRSPEGGLQCAPAMGRIRAMWAITAALRVFPTRVTTLVRFSLLALIVATIPESA